MMSLPFPPLTVSSPAVPASTLLPLPRVMVGTPVTLAKFTGAEPRMLPPVSTRLLEELEPPYGSLPACVAAFPRTLESVSVMTLYRPAMPPPLYPALLPVTVELVSVIVAPRPKMPPPA